jgi:hypothetical protein
MVLEMIRQGRLVQLRKAQQRPRVSKLRSKGLSCCHPSGQQPRQPDGEPEGQIKSYSHDNLLKEAELKAAPTESTIRAKDSLPRKAQRLKKGKTLTLGSNLAVLEGGGGDGDEVANE